MVAGFSKLLSGDPILLWPGVSLSPTLSQLGGAVEVLIGSALLLFPFHILARATGLAFFSVAIGVLSVSAAHWWSCGVSLRLRPGRH